MRSKRSASALRAAAGLAIAMTAALISGCDARTDPGAISIRLEADGTVSIALCEARVRVTQIVVSSQLPESTTTLIAVFAGDGEINFDDVVNTETAPAGMLAVIEPVAADADRNVIVQVDGIRRTALVGGGSIPEMDRWTGRFAPQDLVLGRWLGPESEPSGCQLGT